MHGSTSQNSWRRVTLLVLLLLVSLALVVAIGLRLNPVDPAALPLDGLIIGRINQGTVAIPSCTFQAADHPQLLTVARGSNRIHLDAHNLDGRVTYTRHGIDERLCFLTMHDDASDLDGDDLDDLLYSAHYREGALVASDAPEVDSVVVGLLSFTMGYMPFWTVHPPGAVGEASSWNVEVSLPDVCPGGEQDSCFVLNVGGRGAWFWRKSFVLFRKGVPPRLIREYDLGVTANAYLERPGRPSQLWLGGRAAGGGGYGQVQWTQRGGRDTLLHISGHQGSAFLLDSDGSLKWAAVLGEGCGATLVHTLDPAGDTLLCTFIEQAFTDADSLRRVTRLWFDRDSGRALFADTLSGLFRPFSGPAVFGSPYLGLGQDLRGIRLIGARKGESRLLQGLRLPINDFPLPLIVARGGRAFALAEGDGISLFTISGQRLAMLSGNEPVLGARYEAAGRVEDRLLPRDGPDATIVALVAKPDHGWLLWRLRWPLAMAAALITAFGVLIGWILFQGRKARLQAGEATQLEQRHQEETSQLLSLNQQLDEVVRRLRTEVQEQSQATSRLLDRTSLLADIIDGHSDAILVVDGMGRMLQMNRTCSALFNLERNPSASGTLQDCGVELLLDFQRRLRQGTLPKDNGYYIHSTPQPKGTYRININSLEGTADHPRLLMISIRNISNLVEVRQDRLVRHQHPEIVGESRPLLDLLQQIEEARDTLSNVLILGESGTGKELVADALHRTSAVAQGPLVKFNCAALPGGLLESELFGHVRGAFTGATNHRVGRFEAAHGGTLFIDEIGDLDTATQVKLLRVLETGELQRVGESTTRKVKVRIIAATHQDLAIKLETGEFRRDLFYRLNVLALKVPSLRERREDIPLLADHFVGRLSDSMRRGVRGIDEEALTFLQAYDWPGNVRELRNVLERAVMSCHEDRIRPSHLPAEVLSGTTIVMAGVEQESSPPRNGQSAPLTRAQLARALEENYWNVSTTARRLGISRTSVYTYMRELGMRRPGRSTEA